MKKFMLMGSTALGAMTAAERRVGRYMRAPDGHGDGAPADDFAEFEAAGTVEVGDSNKAPGDAEEGEAEAAPKPKPRKPAAAKTPVAEAPAADAGEGDAEDVGEGDGEDDEGGEEQPAPKPRKTASERIRELNSRLRNAEREMATLKNGGLQPPNGGANSPNALGDAPDPTDLDKYPLGHLDDRYFEDRLQYGILKGIQDATAADRQREADSQSARQQHEEQEALMATVDDLTERGSEIYDDFQESVVEAGMRGDWELGRTTFEAAAEAENGIQILYELSQDKKEAARIAKLSNLGQLKFVQERDAEIGKKQAASKKPQAGAPPTTRTRGANSTTAISPSTDNLDDFEKAWEADAKKNG